MKNTLGDLNNYLFAQIERIDNDDLNPEELDVEIKRAEMVTKIAGTIISNADLALKAAKFKDDRIDISAKIPEMLEG